MDRSMQKEQMAFKQTGGGNSDIDTIKSAWYQSQIIIRVSFDSIDLLSGYISKSLNDGYYLLGIGKEYDVWLKDRESEAYKAMREIRNKR